jgi:2-dehydro-3-deoxyphosphogluconate aldolase / (4S)-4-hydroxy-2-oxoglutarate aldolase
MTRDQIRTRIEEIGIIPAIRLSSARDALFAAEVISGSGIPIVEVTTTVPGAVEVIGELARNDAGFIVGAGTVLDIGMARRCLNAGAKFLASPGLDLEIVEFALKHDVLVLPGALTPTEITAASKAGADFVKVFPCSQLGGPAYIRALRAPFPNVPLIASGGVNQNTATDFILAGAAALGIGRDLIPPDAIEHRQRDWIRELARRFLRIVNEARAQRGHHETYEKFYSSQSIP